MNLPDCEDIEKLSNEKFTSCRYERFKASCFIEKQEFNRAIMSLHRYLSHCDTSTTVLLNLSHSYDQLGEYQNAEAFSKIAVLHDPQSTEAYLYLTISYYKQRKLLEAAELLRNVSGINDDDQFCFITFLVYYETREIEKARPYIERAIELNKDADIYKLKYAGLLGYLKETEKAIRIAENVYNNQKMDMTYYEICELLAKLYLQIGQAEKACMFLEEIKNLPSFENIYSHLIKNCE